VGRPHGLSGEVAVSLSSDRVERLATGAVLYHGDRPLVVVTSRRHANRWLVRFEGVNDRSAAEGLRGAVLTADPLAGTPPDDLWVHDVVGVPMRDLSGTPLGRVVAVEANPAHDLLVLEDGTLVPAVFVVEHDRIGVVVDVPEGLLDVNRPPA
jgi:16S rRNA processing protein RimM